MEGGMKLFNRQVKMKIELDCEVNGISFKIQGDGSQAKLGDFSMHAYCTTGEVPVSWVSLGSTLLYGFGMLAEYPNGVYDWFKDQFPDGYIMDRTIKFEGDGTFNSHHEYSMEEDTIVAKVTLKGEGFNADGPVMGKKIESACPNFLNVFPTADGCRSDFTYMYKLKDGNYLPSHYNTRYKGIRKDATRLPLYHHKLQYVLVMKDTADPRDHAVLRETIKALAVEPITSIL
uniref:Fluorescent protein ScSuFP n=1 Tax=Scolionema suvaense TaxID=340365 RepID=A0A2Z5XV34_9CNID|nr:fluorescent protein ScSuFP [Scolionema suvaense]